MILDLRHIFTYEGHFIYGKDWSIAISIDEKINSTDWVEINPIKMPSIYLNTKIKKNDKTEFSILANKDIRVRIDILLFSGLFSNYLPMFLDTAFVRIIQPERALLDTHKVYGIFIDSGFEINIPVNLPNFDTTDYNNYPAYEISLAHTDYSPEIRNDLIPKKNVFNPNKVLWDEFDNDENSRYIPMLYLPYFSNCRGYGNILPIFSLFEQQEGCENVYNRSEIKEVTQMSFLTYDNFMGDASGLEPNADKCENVLEYECIYDDFLSGDPDQSYWFGEDKLGGGSELFYITRLP